MTLVDYIELSDDEEMIVKEEHNAHVQCHASQMEVETVDLSSEEDNIEEDNNAHGKSNTAQSATTSHRREFAAPHGQGDAAQRTTLCKQEFVAAGNGVEETIGNQEFLEGGDVTKEAMQSANQDFVAGHCMEEAMLSENAAEAAASPSMTEQGVAADECAEEAVQSKNGAEAAASSSVTEQDATTSLSMRKQAPFPRQFWKAGEYKDAAQAAINHGQNCLRIHPKFLHSNATSHKWAFGAIAELLDNAVDEVHNGATYVKIDKMKYSPVGEYSLVIQDDGGGMSPEYLRHCMSFGFSNKCTNSSIGQYGNGFKTSTMRLGADVIIFSCRQDNRLTRSVGLLSYTFLTRTGCNDILVPVVDYEFAPSSCTYERIMERGEKHFSSNLSTLLTWSPFSTEEDLLNQFRDMGCHGTKIVVFNLWFNDAWEMELDFTTDDEDIMISGAPEIPEERKKVERLNHMHIANRFRYSLRVYASVLYLHLPEHFKVILCGRVVKPHHIVNDLIYCECIKYRPQVGVSAEVDVITTIGFLKGAPKLDIYGFNVYHRNRLILPFWSAQSERGHGRGIAGVLEANFIRPTHDKQDFERTGIFQRLETRLKDMTTEYWKYHAHLIGYRKIAQTLPPAHYASVAATNDDGLAARATTETYAGNSRAKASIVLDPCSNGVTGTLEAEPCKRRNSCSMIESRAQKRKNTNDYANHPGSVNVVEMGDEMSRVLIYQNKTLKAECSELVAAQQQLQCKANKLRNELCEWQRVLKGLTDELKFHDGLSALQHDLHRNSSCLGWGWI